MNYFQVICLVTIGGLVHAQNAPTDEAFKEFATVFAARYNESNSNRMLNIKPVQLSFFEDLTLILDFKSGRRRQAKLAVVRNKCDTFEVEIFSVNSTWLQNSCDDIVAAAEHSLTINDVTNKNCTVVFTLQSNATYYADNSRCVKPDNIKLLYAVTCEYLYFKESERIYPLLRQESNELPSDFRASTNPCLG